MGRKRKGRPVNGVLLLDKSLGMSSNGALQRAKRLFGAAKAGHTGSLDPLASGVLPLCFGEATKFSQYLLDADKRYQSTFRLGVKTTSGDADGDVLAEVDASHVTRADVELALRKFDGEIEQVPSMFSALKHEGQPLYKLARQGKTIEREARRITIYSIEVLDFRPGVVAELDVDVHCSKGTYIRSLAEDLGEVLGVGGMVQKLHRTQSGPFTVTDAVTLDELENRLAEAGTAESLDDLLLPMDAPVATFPLLTLPETTAFYFGRGQAVMDGQAYRLGAEGDIVRVASETGEFLGLGELTDDGKVAPKRLVVY